MRMRLLRSVVWGLGGVLLAVFLGGCNTQLKRAREAVGKKDYEQAAQLYEKVVMKDPDNDDALRELTELYCGKHLKNDFKCYGKSRILFKRYPKDATVSKWYKTALYASAVDSYLSNQLKRASRYLESYKKLDPKNARVFFMLGNIMMRMNMKPPRNNDELNAGLKYLAEALKYSKPNDMVALSSKKQKAMLQWEVHMQSANIYEFFIAEKFQEFMKKVQKEAAAKAKAAAKQKKKRRRRRKKKKKEEGPKFEPNPKYFKAAVEACKKAGTFSERHPNPFKRSLPFFKLAMMHANFKKEYETAIKWLKVAEKWGPNDLSVVGNIKMIYDKLAEKAEEDKNKKKQKLYEKLSQEYAAKHDSLKGKR